MILNYQAIVEHLDTFFKRYPQLICLEEDLRVASNILVTLFEGEGKLLVCGNGGSAADAEHIVGELMKGFLKERPLSDSIKSKLLAKFPAGDGEMLGSTLQEGFAAIALGAQSALCTAVGNDLGGEFIYAQQVMALGSKGDVLLAISTSGNARNVILAAKVAQAKEMRVIGLTGRNGGALAALCTICLQVPAEHVHFVQEFHLPVYHALCGAVEAAFFNT